MAESGQANGLHHPNEVYDLNNIVRALETIYDGRTSNESRQNATNYLDRAKSQRSSPSFGFQLAQDRSQPPAVRHYGLSCIENHVRYHWDSFQEDHGSGSDFAVVLAQQISQDDPQFLRNKVAYFWAVLAERAWPQAWENFDAHLFELWQGSIAQQEAVLHILETLSDEVFSKEDSIAGTRGVELGKFCVVIFTSSTVLDSVFGDRKSGSEVRYGSDGWFSRLLDVTRQFLQQEPTAQKSTWAFVVKVLGVLRSIMSWLVPKSVTESDCVELLCRCLLTPYTSLQMAATEALHALFHRQNGAEDGIEKAVLPLLTNEGVALLRRVYDSLSVDIDDLDDSKYTTLKKYSEVICAVGMYLVNQRSVANDPATDLGSFLDLLLVILQNPSLVVSVPVLYLWTRLLSSEHVLNSPSIPRLIGALLELCSSRLIRYEMLPSSSMDITLQFLNEDFETLPEKHAFLGNYRRFCAGVVERIVRKEPSDALVYILSQSDELIQSVRREENETFSEQSFATDTTASLRVDAQSSVISTALKSFMHVVAHDKYTATQLDDSWRSMQTKLEQWCISIVQSGFKNPVIQKRLLSLVVEISVTALPPHNSQVSIEICKSVLSSIVYKNSDSTVYDDAVKELQAARPRELQKLATSFADQLLPIYNDLEAEVTRLAQDNIIDSRMAMEYRAFLFTVIIHSTTVDAGSRSEKLRSTVEPVIEAWKSPTVDRAITNFSSFCEVLGLEDFPNIFLSCGAGSIEDWSSVRLDERGTALKDKIKAASDALPLLPTRSLLSPSTDRLPEESPIFKYIKSQWKPHVPMILSRLLPLITHAHAFNNPNSWSNQPPEIATIINRIIQDRVWQNGISNETRDDFYARIRDSKGSLEGLASAIRGSLRTVRELCMFIIHYFSNFGEDFYGIEDLSTPLSAALYTDAYYLSSHQVNALIKVSTAVIWGCPFEHRRNFLPPILISFFKQLDAKISAEWDAIEQRKSSNAQSDNDLDSEMKAESVLRNLTHATVMFVSTLLGSLHKASTKSNSEFRQPTVRSIILESTTILEPLIVFCTHAIRLRDSRCCGIVTRILRDLLPEFTDSLSRSADQPTDQQQLSPKTSPRQQHTQAIHIDPATAAQVREYFASDVLKACITSLNEPYFSDPQLQRDLAALIAGILVQCSRSTPTVKQVLLSLPGMSEQTVDRHLHNIYTTRVERMQRSWVLTLLEGVRGRSIHEAGKLAVGPSKTVRNTGSATGTLRDQYMAVDDGAGAEPAGGGAKGGRDASPDLGGVADLFG